jgi:alanyl aminopeptidase
MPPPVGAKVPSLRLPEGARPTRYKVALELDPSRSVFSGAVDIQLELAQPTSLLWLNATALTIREAHVVLDQKGGEQVRATAVKGSDDFIGFSFERPVGPGPARLSVAYDGRVPDKETGGIFRQKDGEDWYIYTQFESLDARRAFPCFDEPSYKVPWKLTITVPKPQVALSNTPLVDAGEEKGEAVTFRFTETKPLPSYLVAFAVGPFETVDAGKVGRKETPLRVVTPRGRTAEARHAASVSPPLFTLLEEVFGIPYPYEKLDLIAVPQFGGAMENPGLVTFGANILLAKPGEETVAWKRSYAEVYAHEVAHQWFGDLVTTAWWDDIWLNEAFASWLGPKAVDRWKPEWDGSVERVADRSGAMGQDTLATARMVRQPIRSKSDIANAFDGITYEKGRAVLEMFEAFIGREKFFLGVRHYLERHAFKNATSADFVAAISAAAGTDVAPAFSSFLDQPGVPLVSVDLACPAGGPPRVTLAQKRYLPLGSKAEANQKWLIPMCLKFPAASGGTRRQCLVLSEPRAEVALAETARCPEWLLANDAMSGYYRTLPSHDLMRALLDDGGKRLTLAERVGMVSDLRALVESGQLKAGVVLDLVPVLLREGGENRHILASTASIVAGLDEHLVSDEMRPNYVRFVRKMYGARAQGLGWKAKAGEAEDLALMRRTVVRLMVNQGQDPALVAEGQRMARAWLDDRKAVDSELVDLALGVAARTGDRALYDRVLAEVKKTKQRRDRRRLIETLGTFDDPALVKENLGIFMRGELEPRESTALLFGARRGAHRRAAGLAYQFIKDNYDAVVAKMPQGNFAGTQFAANLPYVAATECSESARADVEAFFRDRAAKITGGERVLAQVLEVIDLCAKRKAAQQESVAAFLKRW